MRVLALDLGTRRIGVAVSDATATLASPAGVVERCGDRSREHARIAGLVDELEAERVVVGMPIGLDGSIGAAATSATEEIAQLAALLAVPVEAVDERFTTVTAHQLLEASGHRSRSRRGKVDAAAAAVMLQVWLDGHGTEDGR